MHMYVLVLLCLHMTAFVWLVVVFAVVEVPARLLVVLEVKRVRGCTFRADEVSCHRRRVP